MSRAHSAMLRKILKNSGWTQRQLARVIGVSGPTVHIWLTGKTGITPANQRKIAAIRDNMELLTLLGDAYALVRELEEALCQRWKGLP